MASAHARLLSPGRIGSLELRNRILLTPMGTNLEADDGTPGERITRFYEERSRGGVGCILVGVTGVAWPAGVSNPHNMGLSRDEFVPSFRTLADRVHAHGAKIAVQLQHAGRVALQDVLAGRALWTPSLARDKAGDLFDALAPEEIAAVTSPYTQPTSKLAYHEMTEDDVAQLARWFADAAERAKAAGLDAVEIHAGHGYILSSFLSPSTNLREDALGGPLENRAKPLLAVIRAVRERVGPDFALWCRLDGTEYHKPRGITPEDARRTAELAVAAGLDAIHVSAYADSRSGLAFTDAPLPHQPGAYLDLARGVKERVDVPVIAVGRIDPDRGEAALAEGAADFIAMGRALIADPELPKKLADPGRSIRSCIYSYRCVGNVFLRKASTCVANPAAGREDEHAIRPATTPKRVLVAGGGPAGLEAARIAALCGHSVTLCEAKPQLGGLGRAAGVAEPTNAPLVPHLVSEAHRLGVELRVATELTPALAGELAPDAIVVAVGARRPRPDVPGAELPHVVDVSALCDGVEAVCERGPRVAVLGGDLIAVGVAARLGQAGCQVTLLAGDETLALAMPPPRRWRAHAALADHGVEVLRHTSLLRIEPDAVVYRDADGALHRAACGIVVVARGLSPDSTLADALAGTAAEIHRIGDCTGLGYFEGALESASRVALAL